MKLSKRKAREFKKIQQ